MKKHTTTLFNLVLFSVLLGSSASVMGETIQVLLVDVSGFTEESRLPDDTTQFYASAGSRFKIVHNSNDTLIVRFTGGLNPPDNQHQGLAHVEKEVNYLISTEILTEWSYEIAFGFSWGMLTIPLRVQLSDGNMTTATTLATYFGRSQTIWHIPFTVIGTAGATAIPVAYSGSEGDMSTKIGWTYAFGVLIEPERNFHIGILFGADHVIGDAAIEYPYQDKLWISFTLGVNIISN